MITSWLSFFWCINAYGATILVVNMIFNTDALYQHFGVKFDHFPSDIVSEYKLILLEESKRYKNYITLWISRGEYPLWLPYVWRGFWYFKLLYTEWKILHSQTKAVSWECTWFLWLSLAGFPPYLENLENLEFCHFLFQAWKMPGICSKSGKNLEFNSKPEKTWNLQIVCFKLHFSRCHLQK